MELTDQHLTLLRAAAERDDGLLPRSDRLVGAARRRMADRLLAAGVAEIVPVAEGQPHWFAKAEEGPTNLRITDAGHALVSCKAQRSDDVPNAMRADSEPPAPAAAQGRVHRPGTKRSLLIDLLRREGGVALNALTVALGWQPHTVRAAITRLRQDGVSIDRVPGEGGSIYLAGGDVAPETSADVGVDA